MLVTHVGGLCAALELEGDGLALADHHLAQPLLPEVGQLRPVQHGRGRVRLVSLDLQQSDNNLILAKSTCCKSIKIKVQ